MKSLSGHPKNWLLKNKGFKEKSVDKWDFVHGRIVMRFYLTEMFSKDT
jgi:hypothetical protein